MAVRCRSVLHFDLGYARRVIEFADQRRAKPHRLQRQCYDKAQPRLTTGGKAEDIMSSPLEELPTSARSESYLGREICPDLHKRSSCTRWDPRRTVCLSSKGCLRS